MTRNFAPRPLPAVLRTRGERYYDTDLSSVRLRLFDAATNSPVLAFTRGDGINLEIRTLGLPAAALLELLGHELAHVVQQRQERVPGVALERQAIREGRRFAAGCRAAGFPGTALRRVRRPVIQCAVAVGGEAIEAPSALSEISRKVLALIPTGLQWLAWAIANPSDVYGFVDEASLVEAVQVGLHGDASMLLRAPSLQISVRRLLELRLEELSLIETLESQGSDNRIVDVNTKRMLAANNLWTQADLAVGRDFVGDDLEPVFQSLGLADQVHLFDLVEGSSTEAGLDPGVQEESTQFALEHAISAPEFTDYYRLYVAVADGIGSGKGAAARRGNLARELAAALAPRLYGLLKCPFVNEDLTPAAMMRVVREWLGTGNAIGFPRISHGIYEVLRYGGASALEPGAAAASVASYVEAMRTLLLTGESTSSELTQDGSTRIYRVDGEKTHAELAHRRHHATLTLESFQRK